MNIHICTLFEGDYHKGVAVLVNSLVINGFKGIVFAGFRGELPPWTAVQAKTIGYGASASNLQVTEDVSVRFLPLKTKDHLTNHKPEFMLSLWRGEAKDCDVLLYLDPDIVVNESWSYFEDWLQCGVTLCEDVNSPLHATHPRREGWRQFYGPRGIDLRAGESVYVNGGAVGTRRQDLEFLHLWERLVNLMAEEIGGLASAKVEGGQSFADRGFANCFDSSDQDSLNAALEAYHGVVSILGQDAMGLKPGHALLPHAIGNHKPWKCSYVLSCLGGKPPRSVDKQFWRYSDYPIRAFSGLEIAAKRIALGVAAAVGRFYRRR
jgi:hypothetical protein